MERKLVQAIRYATSDDGTSLAWMRSGKGPALVKVANWMTHLEYDRESPLWSHWVNFLEQNFNYLRFDERGCGLSDRKLGKLNFDAWVQDIEAVVDQSGIEQPAYLLGISQGAGTAIGYAIKHPEKVAGLILIGGYARGALHRSDENNRDLIAAMCQIFRLGWGQDNPAFKDVYTANFVLDGDPEKRRWFHELLDKTVTPDAGADLLMARAEVDVSSMLAQVKVPTLVIHVRDDVVTPVEEARILAAGIPGAQLAIIEGRNHIIQESEPAWDKVQELVLEFCGQGAVPHAVAGLTPRENDVLGLICAAKNNKEIARDLNLTEKTVRNHASNLFAKIGVNNRQAAIVKMAGKV